MVEILVCHLCGAKFTEGNGGGFFKEFHYSRQITLCPRCAGELLDFFQGVEGSVCEDLEG